MDRNAFTDDSLWSTIPAAGDVERDFWLAYDLLQNPKDHAEFTIVRNWVQKALEVSTLSTFKEQQHSALHGSQDFL